jgi:hypothetical protein
MTAYVYLPLIEKRGKTDEPGKNDGWKAVWNVERELPLAGDGLQG